MTQESQEDLHYKIIVIGDSGVGKSNLILQYTKNIFDPQSKSTIMMEYFEKFVTINTRDHKKKNIKVSLWDTAGQANVYYKKAVGAVLVYDITKKETFLNMTSWYKEVMDKGEEGVQCIVIGNKLDLSHLRQVDEKEGKNFASRFGLSFFECSAKENTNIEEAFTTMVDCVYNKGHPITFDDVVNVVKEKTRQLDNDLSNAKNDIKDGKCC